LPFYALFHLARAAFWAISLRSAAVNFAALASPRFAAAVLTGTGAVSSISPVAICPTRNASSFRSRGRGGVERFLGMGGI
jgi:hypothetical protein